MSSPEPRRLPLDYARRCAERLTAWLTPFTERLEVAGSIRRKLPTCGDIDLVAIPRTAPQHDLIGDVMNTRNLMAEEIRRTCRDKGWLQVKDGENYVVFEANGIQVDIWFGTAATFGSLLMCRTGSKDHNIWLASAAGKRGGHWNPHHGLRLHGKVHGATEEEIYSALGVPYLVPEARNHSFPPVRG
jgi:DNA polymerase (family 10)